MNLDIRKEVSEAYNLIGSHIRKTPVEFSPELSELTGSNVYLKFENWQVTGSFKVRGALNKILPLRANGKSRIGSVVTASTGNHAAGVAYALGMINQPGIIFLPENASPAKVEKLKKLKGISLEFFGDDSVVAEREAKRYAEQHGCIYVSPYNDMDVIAGQGTIGYEISEQLEKVDSVFVPVGGGGLVSGISGFLKNHDENIEIIGCQAENSAVMSESVREGRILDLPSLPTISDGTAGGVEEDSITFEFCNKLVDSWIRVNEDEILTSLRYIMNHHYMVVEGSAGLALASLIREKARFTNKTVVLILCGSKFNSELLKMLVCQ